MTVGAVLSLDVGTKTIGVAVTDAGRRLVFPDRTLQRRGVAKDAAAVAELCRGRSVTQVVVGLPLTPDGGEGRSARLARQVAEAVGTATGLPVAMQDERYSTVEADFRLAEAGADSRARRGIVDAHAAAVILEDWLAKAR
jgi:putative Holliday junction resolvase